MVIIEKERIFHFGLLFILIAIPLFLLSSFLINSPFFTFGIISDIDIANYLFLFAFFLLIVGLYFFGKHVVNMK